MMAPEMAWQEYAIAVADINMLALSQLEVIQSRLARAQREMTTYSPDELRNDLWDLHRILKGQRAPRLEDAPDAGR
jgi:folate-binding Fe-S cluster repair protein YgfZ